ncbi:Protein SHORTAGE IN CHIASMATA 1 [Linum perenne]
MRSRFLNIDYFTSPPAVETLDIVELPVPTFAPSRLFTVEEYFHGLEDAAAAAVSLEVGKLPIESALSRFIDAVLPQVIDFEVPELEDGERGCGVEYETFVLGSGQIEKDDGSIVADKSIEGCEVIVFEAPELDTFVGDKYSSMEGLQRLSEVSYLENTLDLPMPGLKMQHLQKIHESIYSEAEVSVEHDVNQNLHAYEDDGSIQMKTVSNHDLFPALEVNETNLRTYTDCYTERQLLSFLENAEIQCPSDEMEPFGHAKGDIFKVPTDHCLSKEYLDSEVAHLDSVFAMDNISTTEAAFYEDSNTFPSPAEPIIFHEPEFLGTHSSQILETFFDMQRSCESGISDTMIYKELNSRNFNELVVSSELALIDDGFRTLPVPIISDHDRTRSMHTILGGVLMGLKEETLSTSDNIYLDWHFLDGDICSCKISCHSFNVEDFDSHTTKYMESFDDGNPMLDFILSDETLFTMEDHKESLDVLPEGLHGSSSTRLSGEFPEPGKLRQLDDQYQGKASKLFKSMSQFNDLEFFLNPGKATARDRSETADKVSKTNPLLPEERVPHLGENVSQQCLDPQLNSIPVAHKVEKGSAEASYKVAPQGHCVPSATKSESNQGRKVSGPETVIVVNTQNFDKEMIISRRSTYNKILAMEKEGTEVVERDIDLPVDVLISSAMCLAWYDCKNIRKQATTMGEALSCFRLCIDNIATQVLTLLSFSFNGCILVFEGESDFLSAVMEFSDGLYAAAAGLGIDLQIFCSYSSELTDEIILSSILHSTKVCRSSCPEMPESETLAESFLTKFPSINPLTAHAILSSGGTLIDFLEWSHERRILAVQQHHIPEESIALFSSLCKYGARDDSKSAMTDSVSSISNGADSDKRHLNLDSERKRRKYVHNLPNADICMDDEWNFEPADNTTKKTNLTSTRILQKDHWESDMKDILDELKQPISNLTDFLEEESNAAAAVDFSSLPGQFGTQHSRGVAKEIDRISNKGKSLDQNQGSGVPLRKRLKKYDTSEIENLHKGLKGVTIDLTCSPSPDKEVPSVTNSSNFSWMCEEDQDFTTKPRAARKLSYKGNSMFTFPTASEINSEPDRWASFKDHGQSLQDNHGCFDFDNNQEKVPSELRNEFLREIPVQRNAGTPARFPMKEMPYDSPASLSKDVHSSQPVSGETPLSRAIHSSQPQAGSPWTIEFLNRIREKTRLRKLSLPNDASPAAPGSKTETSRHTKTRSPSVLDYFKYQGGRTPERKPGPMKQKLPIRSSISSRTERVIASLSPVHTPIDRRAKQTLSFATNGSGSQTKLVWTDGGARPLNKKFRKF